MYGGVVGIMERCLEGLKMRLVVCGYYPLPADIVRIIKLNSILVKENKEGNLALPALL
jgi:hypothetical protein